MLGKMANGTSHENDPPLSPRNCTSTPYRKHETCDFPELPSHVFVIEGCPPSQQGNYRVSSSTPQSASATDSKYALTTLSSEAGGLNASHHHHHHHRSQKGFNIKTLRDCLESCLEGVNGGIDLDSYLDAYGEICKLLDELGTVMKAHIGKDIKHKIALMRAYRSSPNGAFYKSIEKMVTFEKIKKIPQTNPDENGSRTILILHRSLKFVIEFLRSLNTLKEDQGVGNVGREVYNRTLAPYHPWAYRHIARLAFSALGKKGQLVANFHDGSMTLAQLQEVIECVVNAATQVFIRCQAIYEKNNFLNLP